jgi:hypothetical protein
MSLSRTNGAANLYTGMNVNATSPYVTLATVMMAASMQLSPSKSAFVVGTNTSGDMIFEANNEEVLRVKPDKSVVAAGKMQVYGELYRMNPSRISVACNTFTFNIPTNTPTVIPFNQYLTNAGSKITLNTTNGLINLLDIGIYEVFFTWAPHSIVDTRMNASYVIRNPSGGVAVGPTVWTNHCSSPHFTTTFQVTAVPSTIEFRAMHYLGSDLRLATSTSVGEYWTYASVLFLG